MRIVEQSVGLKGLAFETDPGAGDREMLPMMDAQGRIAGFLTWEKTYPMMDAMKRLMPFIAAIAIVLVAFVGISLAQLRRARRELAASQEEARRAADEDKLTGLPNHAKTLELLDLALAERADDAVTTFALIELDGMADVHAQLGVLGSDELVTAVAARLKEALPPDAVCGRIGGDQFAAIITAGGATNAGDVIRAALDATARPHWVDTVVRISAHAGFAQAPRHADTRGELSRRAEPRAAGGSQERAPAPLSVSSVPSTPCQPTRNSSNANCRARSAANELDLHYQPIVSANGARIVGVEALLALDPCHARRNRSRDVHSRGRADGPDGHARRLRAAPRAATTPSAGRTFMWRSICRRCRCATAPSSNWCVRHWPKAACRRPA